MRNQKLITSKQRLDIRKEYRRTGITQQELATKYGISLSTISRICRRPNKNES